MDDKYRVMVKYPEMKRFKALGTHGNGATLVNHKIHTFMFDKDDAEKVAQDMRDDHAEVGEPIEVKVTKF